MAEDASFGEGRQSHHHVLATQLPVPGAIMVPVDSVERDPAQPRRDWRHDNGYERLDDLTRSIQEFGILQPLVVRRADDHYVVIAGGRRLVAAKRGGLTHVPVIVRDEEGARVRVLQLVENVQRQQLTPLDEARAYQELMEIEGLTVAGIAARVHVSTQTVRDKLRLLRDQVLADAVERAQISATAAREISKLPDEFADQLRQRIQAGERLHVSDIHGIRAQLHAAGIVNPRWNPRASAAGKQDANVQGQAADSPAIPLAEQCAPTQPGGALHDHETAAVDATPAWIPDTDTAGLRARTVALGDRDVTRLHLQGPRSTVSSSASSSAAMPDATETGTSFDLNRAMAATDNSRSLRDLLLQIPYEQLESLLEYAVARGWSAAGLLHIVRVERTKLTNV